MNRTQRIVDLPDALEAWEEIEQALRGRQPVVFLDFDGTLAPIVADPAAAALPSRTRSALEALAAVCPVVIVSGRDADDVRERVRLDDVVVAGSHGFDVIWPDGRRSQRGQEHVPRLDAAAARLRRELVGIPGVEVEPKRFAVAVHHRRTPAEQVAEIDDRVDRVVEEHPGLRRSGGKQVMELRPDLDWDKGTTVLWLLTELGLDHEGAVPLYLGDDLTDEDAFVALEQQGHGLTLVVRGEDDQRPTAARYAVGDVGTSADVLTKLARLATANR